MDPFSVLGVQPAVTERQLASAYRAAARRWHPDRPGGDAARMTALNDAYAAARAELRRARRLAPAPVVVRRRAPPGAWLPQPVRRRLGAELLAALGEGERVRLVARAGRTGAGAARLALTDRRLLWVVEDAVTARVDWVGLGAVAAVEERRGRLFGRRATLALRTRTGRRVSFGDLEPAAARAIARDLAGGAATA